MESNGIVELYGRSAKSNLVRYNPHIGDGNSRAFEKVKKAQPYGPEFQHNKDEDVGHITKRMGSNLKTLVKKSVGNYSSVHFTSFSILL